MKKRCIGSIIIGIGAMVIIVLAFILSHAVKIESDFERLRSEAYDTLFLSMFPVNNYEEEDFMFYRGLDCVKTDYVIPHGKILRKYMETAKETDNNIKKVYLGIDPEHTSKEDIVIMIQENPDTFFEVILAYPQIEYWTDKKAKDFNKIMDAYQLLAEWVLPLENARIYYFGCEEWLIANTENYEDVYQTNVEVSEFLMCNADELHPYEMTGDDLKDKFDAMRALVEQYRDNPIVYPTAENVEIVFIGDSIIGNYTNSLSVPEVVKGLSGAMVYNLGYGGCSAALNPDKEGDFAKVLDALFSGDVSDLPAEASVSAGIKTFVEREASNRQMMFVINFALNDYYDGLPIVTGDKDDVYSFKGAMRNGVMRLQENYPEAQILLMTPNKVARYQFGEEQTTMQGGVLAEYAQAVREVAKELDVDVLDNFEELPITEDNWETYISDQTHLNEAGRFLLGSRIAQRIKIQE